MDVGTILVSLGGALLASGGVAAGLVQARSAKPVVKADAAETVTDAALELMAELKADAKATRAELATVRVEAESLAGRLRGLIAAIHDPIATVDPIATIKKLRAMTSIAQGGNGHGPS